MFLRVSLHLVFLLVAGCRPAASALDATQQTKNQESCGQPKKVAIRTVSALVTLANRQNIEGPLQEALAMLKYAQQVYQAEGVAVRTLRIITDDFTTYSATPDEGNMTRIVERLNAFAREHHLLVSIGSLDLADIKDNLTFYADFQRNMLAEHKHIFSSMSVVHKGGVDSSLVEQAVRTMEHLRDHHAAGESAGESNFRFAATAGMDDATQSPFPFFTSGQHRLPPGSKLGFALGLESVPLLKRVLHETREQSTTSAVAALQTAFDQALQPIEAIAKQIAAQKNADYHGIDPTPAPLGNDSMAAALDQRGTSFGDRETAATIRIVTTGLKSLSVKTTGFAGTFLPVMEDIGIAKAWNEGRLDLARLLDYSQVCGSGLDTIPLAADTSREKLTAIIERVAQASIEHQKPLTARLLMVPGVLAGQTVEFPLNPFLFPATARTP